MHAIASAAIKDRSTISPSLPISPKIAPVQNEEQERTPTPSRFAAAQQLFKRQQTVPLKPPSPPFIPSISSTRVRSFTASSSLYSKIGQSIQAETTTCPEERARAVSSPAKMAFGQSFGQPKPHPIVEPPPAAETPVLGRDAPVNSRCILPGPKYMNRPFDITAISGRTETGKAAWWCRHDRLVVFDGLTPPPEDEPDTDRHWKRLLVRTSKGLEMSRKNCKKEVIHVDIPTGHCRMLLGKEKWVFEAKVKRSRVCGGCLERCWGEVERQEAASAAVKQEDRRRDYFLMLEEKGMRRIQSERNLKGEVGVDVEKKMEDPGFVKETADLRKVRSDWQLQHATTASIDEVLVKKMAP